MLAALLLGGIAAAGPVDMVGVGAASMGRGGGGMALADGPEAAFLNPAGLAALRAPRFELGAALLRTDLRPVPALWWDTNRDGLLDVADDPLRVEVNARPADFVRLGIARPVGRRFGMGLSFQFPTTRLIRIETVEPALPHYLQYQNRLQRYEAAVGFGWEQIEGIRLGGAVEVLVRARYGLVSTLDVGADPAAEGGLGDVVGPLVLDVHQMTIDIVPAFAPIVSAQWDVGAQFPALEGLRLGGSWRGGTGLPVDVNVDVQANLRVAPTGGLGATTLPLVAPFALSVYDHSVPDKLTVGAGLQVERWAAALDVYRLGWDEVQVNVTRVVDGALTTPLLSLTDPSLRDGNPYTLVLAPVVGVRGGAEADLPPIPLPAPADALTLTLRGGGGYEPTPLQAQGAGSAFLDGDRAFGSVGLGLRHGDPFGLVGGPVRWDAFAQLHRVARGILTLPEGDPPRPGAPIDGAPLPIGGSVWAAGAQFSVDF